MKKAIKSKVISAILIAALMIMYIPYLIIPANAATYITNASAAKGSDYTTSPTMAAIYDKIFAGDIDIIQDSSGKEVNMPLGSRLLDYNDANSKYKIVSKTSGNPYYAWECQAYANAVYNKLFNEWVGNGGSFAHSKTVISGGINCVSYSLFVQSGVRSGAYIRTTNHSSGAYNGDAGHAMIVLSYDSTYINYIEGNADGYGLIRITKRTWSEFNSAQLSGRGRYISHIVQPNDSYYDSLYSDSLEGSIIDIARKQLGSYGSDINKFTTWFYGKQTSAAWCAIFISWCANELGVLNSSIPKEANCNNMMNWFKNKGAFYDVDSDYTPQKGDIVFFNTQGTGSNHVEFIAESGYTTVNGQKRIKTIGGNTSDSSYNGADYVAEKSRNINEPAAIVIGYAHPSYNGSYSINTNPDDYTFPTRELYYTSPLMTGNDVGWVQAFLCQMGYTVDIDLKFGPDMDAKVRAFQKDYGLTVDGCVGSGTRAKMRELWEQKKHTECTWNDGEVTVPATHLQEGIITYTCTECGNTKTEYIPRTYDHDFTPWEYHNETHHSRYCECNYTELYEHTWDSGKTIKQPSHTEEGVITFTCTGCYANKQQAIPKLKDHSYGEWENYSDTQHKHICACGDFELGDHIWDDGKVTTAPSYTDEGKMTFTCSECGATKIEIIPKLEGNEYIAGDINSDGAVDNEDSVTLMQYIAGWDVDVNDSALDVNGDGMINNKDVTRLIQYLAGWNVIIH